MLCATAGGALLHWSGGHCVQALPRSPTHRTFIPPARLSPTLYHPQLLPLPPPPALLAPPPAIYPPRCSRSTTSGPSSPCTWVRRASSWRARAAVCSGGLRTVTSTPRRCAWPMHAPSTCRACCPAAAPTTTAARSHSCAAARRACARSRRATARSPSSRAAASCGRCPCSSQCPLPRRTHRLRHSWRQAAPHRRHRRRSSSRSRSRRRLCGRGAAREQLSQVGHPAPRVPHPARLLHIFIRSGVGGLDLVGHGPLLAPAAMPLQHG